MILPGSRPPLVHADRPSAPIWRHFIAKRLTLSAQSPTLRRIFMPKPPGSIGYRCETPTVFRGSRKRLRRLSRREAIPVDVWLLLLLLAVVAVTLLLLPPIEY